MRKRAWNAATLTVIGIALLIVCLLVTGVMVANRPGHAYVGRAPIPGATLPPASSQPATPAASGEADEPCPSLHDTSSPCHAP